MSTSDEKANEVTVDEAAGEEAAMTGVPDQIVVDREIERRHVEVTVVEDGEPGQRQGIGDIGRNASWLADHTVHQKGQTETIQVIRKDVILEVSREFHQIIKSD